MNIFFKEVTCSCCGAKGRIRSFQKTKDGKFLCQECAAELPREFGSKLMDMTFADYRKCMEYKKYSKEVLEPMFKSDLSYSRFSVDSKNRLCRVEGSELILGIDNIVNC